MGGPGGQPGPSGDRQVGPVWLVNDCEVEATVAQTQWATEEAFQQSAVQAGAAMRSGAPPALGAA